MPEIVVRQAGKELSRIPLRAQEITIGRGTGSTIMIMSAVVSRRHARIVRDEGRWVLEDLGSAGGTEVAGRRIDRHVLEDGDEIRIGEYTMTFAAGGGGSLESAAAAADDAAASVALAAGEDPFVDLHLDESLIVGAESSARRPAVAVGGAEAAVAIEETLPPGSMTQAALRARAAAGAPAAPPQAPAAAAETETETETEAETDTEAPADDAEPVDEEERIRSQTVVVDLKKLDPDGALFGSSVAPSAGEAGSRRLKALFEITQTLETSHDFSQVLVDIMDRAIAIMRAERGFLMLADPDTKELRVHVARDAKGSDLTGVDRETVSRSLMQRVRETAKPVLIFDAQSKEWGTKSVMEHSIHSALCAPMTTRDEVTGVLYVDHRSRPLAFNNEDVAFFTTFALQAKAAIDNSRAFWELVEGLFRASDDFIVVCSSDGRIQQVNRAGCEMLGMTEDELRSLTLHELVAREEGEKVDELCRDTLAHGVVSGREIALRGKGGRAVPLSVSSFSLRPRGGSALGLCLIGRDLSYVMSLIGQLTEAKDQVELHNRFIRSTFGRYLSDEIVHSLLETPEGLQLGGEQRKATVLMSDVRGFTSISERLKPEQVVALLNNYLGAMAEIILKYQGTIDEFIGDSILAIFGAPIRRDDDARRAVACAVAMQLEMERVNAWNVEHGLPEIETGIGLNTGEVVVGNIGSAKRAKYGVVGTHVNLASRIETFTLGGQILISEATRQEAGPDLALGEAMPVHAKGFAEPIEVYDLRGVGGEHRLFLPERSEHFADLREPVPVRFTPLEGKHLGARTHEGELVRLSALGAWVRSAQPMAPLENVKLELLGRDGQPVHGDLYAKVVEGGAAGGFPIRFTSLDPNVREFLRNAARHAEEEASPA